MKNIWAITQIQAKRRLRNYRSLAWTFLFPLALIGVFALIFLSQHSLSATLIVIDEDDSPLSGALIDIVSNTSHVELREEEDLESALDLLDRGGGDAVLVIPSGLEDAAGEILADPSAQPTITFEVYYRGEDVEEMDVLQVLLESLAADLNDDIMGGYDGPVQVESHAITEEGWGFTDVLVPLTVSVVMIQASVFSCSNAMAFLRENKVRKRLRCTPIEPPSIAMGIVITEGTVAGLAATLAAAVGSYVFDVPVTIVEFIGVILLAFLSAYVFSFLGVILGNLSHTQMSSQTLSSLVVVPMVFFSSAYVLPAIFPTSLTWLAKILPLSQTTHGLRLLFLHNPTAGDLLPPTLGIVIWGGIFAAISYWQERK